MELNVTFPTIKWLVDQVSWPGSRFRASFSSKNCVKLDWNEISWIGFFKIWFTLLPVLFIVRPSRQRGNRWLKGHSETYCMWLLWGTVLIFTLYDLIGEFRLLNTVLIEYSVGKSLRDSSSQGTEYDRKSGEEGDRESEKQRGELLSGTMLS